MATISKYQTASGATLYRVRYRTPDNRSTQKRGFTTKRDAEQFAATVEVSKVRGEYVAPSVGRNGRRIGPAWLDASAATQTVPARSTKAPGASSAPGGRDAPRRHPLLRRGGMGGGAGARRGAPPSVAYRCWRASSTTR